MISFSGIFLALGLFFGSWSAQAITYDEIFPYYVELCSVSQVKEKGGTPGGIAGHAALYLKGVCRDTSAPYPQIKVCNQGPMGDIRHPDSGTSVSVDKQFRNVNWLAVERKSIFINGGLNDVSKLTASFRDALVDSLVKEGVFNGVELHRPEALAGQADDDVTGLFGPAPGITDPRVIGLKTLDTDYAMWFGRTVSCVRLPIPQSKLQPMVDYLNALNQKYAEPTSQDYRNYRWSGVYNNCTHTVVNALAAAGILDSIEFELPGWRQVAFHLAIPMNQFINLAHLGVKGVYPGRRIKDLKLNHPSMLYRHPLAKSLLINHQWLPMQPGAVIEHLQHAENELYEYSDYAFDLKSLPSKTTALLRQLGWTSVARIKQMIDGALRIKTDGQVILKDPKYYDLKANLEYFDDVYSKALSTKPSVTNEMFWNSSLYAERKDFTNFYIKHDAYLRRQLEFVKRARGLVQ
ncbi:MAG: hypothetical protein IT289_01630 [Oligoflexia bacterium]|nr:hypothetical protein [Oligoflexia bacterium]